MTNSALVYEPKCWGAGNCGVSANEHSCTQSQNKLWRSNTIFNLWWEYINCSQIHECGNWESGRIVSFLGIHNSDLFCSVPYTFCELFCYTLDIAKTSELNFVKLQVRGSVDALLFCPKNEDSGTYARLAALPGAEKSYCFQRPIKRG